jgi:hypothetical protein
MPLRLLQSTTFFAREKHRPCLQPDCPRSPLPLASHGCLLEGSPPRPPSAPGPPSTRRSRRRPCASSTQLQVSSAPPILLHSPRALSNRGSHTCAASRLHHVRIQQRKYLHFLVAGPQMDWPSSARGRATAT